MTLNGHPALASLLFTVLFPASLIICHLLCLLSDFLLALLGYLSLLSPFYKVHRRKRRVSLSLICSLILIFLLQDIENLFVRSLSQFAGVLNRASFSPRVVPFMVIFVVHRGVLRLCLLSNFLLALLHGLVHDPSFGRVPRKDDTLKRCLRAITPLQMPSSPCIEHRVRCQYQREIARARASDNKSELSDISPCSLPPIKVHRRKRRVSLFLLQPHLFSYSNFSFTGYREPFRSQFVAVCRSPEHSVFFTACRPIYLGDFCRP
jgi:hypothetical protein